MADELNDGTGATASTDTGGTNPQAAAPDNSSLDSKGASDSPEGYHVTSTDPKLAFPGDQAAQSGAQTPQDGSQSPQARQQQPSKPGSTPDSAPPPPAVQKAIQTGGWTHQVLQALAGGPQSQTTIDPNTGKVTRQEVPLSNQRLGMSIALAALTGAFTGLAEKGPGAEGRAAAGGFEQALQQKQQQKSAEEQEAAKTYARQAAIAQTNFTMHQTAQRMGQLAYDAHKQFVGDAAGTLSNVKTVGADLASGVHSRDLLPKYNVTENNAIPDGIEKRMDDRPGHEGEQATDQYGQPLWDNTYTVVDPQKKIALDDKTAQFLADHHVPGYFNTVDGKTVPKEFNGSAQIKAGLVINGLAQASAIRTTEAQINDQLSKLSGDEGKVDGKVFEANLTQGLQDGSVTPKALQTFAKYASLPFDKAIDQMRKDKVDPDTIGQINSLVPASAQDALAKSRLDRESADKAQRDADAAHTKATSALPDDLKKLGMEEQVRGKFSFANAFQAEAGRVSAKNKYGEGGGLVNHEMVNNPKLSTVAQGIDPNTPVVNGVRQKVLDNMAAVDPGLAGEVRAIGEGRQLQSKYGLAKGDGQRLAALVQLAYPDYNQPKAESYELLQKRFTAGDISDQLRSLNTTFEHAKRSYDNAGSLTASVPGTSAHADYEVDKSQLTEELNHAYTKGVLHDERRKELQNGLNSAIPSVRQKAVKESQSLLSDFANEFQNQWRNGKVTPAAPDAPITSPEGQYAFNDLFQGEKRINRYGTVVGLGNNFKPPIGALPGKDAKGNVVAYKLRDGTYTDPKGNEITQ
jgi:hypothetical protein